MPHVPVEVAHARVVTRVTSCYICCVMKRPTLIPNKAKVLRGSMTLRMLELGFAITVLELAAVLLPELSDRLPFDRVWLLVGASGAQFAAWIGRFILQPKLSGETNADQ